MESISDNSTEDHHVWSLTKKNNKIELIVYQLCWKNDFRLKTHSCSIRDVMKGLKARDKTARRRKPIQINSKRCCSRFYIKFEKIFNKVWILDHETEYIGNHSQWE